MEMGGEETKGKLGIPATSSSGNQSTPFQHPQQQQHYDYGMFQGVATYSHPPPAQPVVGFPTPSVTAPPYIYAHNYHFVPGYDVAEGRPLREPRLPCCGIGIGWLLFMAGFFFPVIPWFAGAMILLFGQADYREKPGLVACMILLLLVVSAVVFGLSGGAEFW